MTSRLKHKLELENVNLKSAYINESFVQVGHLQYRGVSDS
jgi:G patch domain-containing protein 1